MANHFDLAARSILHWDQINGQLQANRPRSEDWNNAWTLLVVQKDHILFGMSPLLAGLDRDNCTCPTNDEVNIQVRLMA
ncbi:hypothetical protein PTTG_03267 [Puccinia triticina 1-1 BBBD Race 1]|uniref:Uncharacterized protein n=1 Tax=Puccinia triticina (isolate 1-1 / race 1 (BBBD)) TaxID=630390 RepID=A0A0C4ER55_PUCT1|nr:hypothetical protein PTTG_03267 [Puccinia triticina 1-1 BBBD Race 1]